MPASGSQSLSSTRKPLIRDTVLDPAGRGTSSSGSSTEGWTMQLRPVQIGLIWLSTLLLMVFVFLFGLRAGHQRGREEALEQGTDQLVRLPVARSNQPEVAEMVSLPPSAPAVAISTGVPAGGATAALSESLKKAESTVSPLQPAVKAEVASSPGFATKEATAVIHSADTSSRAALSTNSASRTADASSSRAMLAAAPVAQPPAASSNTPQVAELGAVATTRESVRAEAKPLETKPASTKPNSADSKTAAANLKRTENNSASLVQDPRAGWYVQLAASNSASEASDLGKKLRARGLSPTIQKTKVKNVMYSRVLVGPYANRVAALDDQQKIKSWGISKGEPFLRYLSD